MASKCIKHSCEYKQSTYYTKGDSVVYERDNEGNKYVYKEYDNPVTGITVIHDELCIMLRDYIMISNKRYPIQWVDKILLNEPDCIHYMVCNKMYVYYKKGITNVFDRTMRHNFPAFKEHIIKYCYNAGKYIIFLDIQDSLYIYYHLNIHKLNVTMKYINNYIFIHDNIRGVILCPGNKHVNVTNKKIKKIKSKDNGITIIYKDNTKITCGYDNSGYDFGGANMF